MRFSVPQYITIEDKLLGLITFRQLFLLLGAFLITFFASKLLSGLFVFFVGFITFGLAFFLGFVQINGRPALSSLLLIFTYTLGNRRYIWQSVTHVQTKAIELPKITEYAEAPITETPPTVVQPPITPEQPPAVEWPTRPIERPAVKVTTPPPELLNQPLAISGKSLLPETEQPYNPYRNFPLPKFPKRRW